jgi:rod shape-determining protein MreD
MRLVGTAIAALAAALLELSVAPHFSVSDAHPHLVLVLGVIATVALGPGPGLAWAFTGGIALDVLAARPIGATAFTLLVVLGGASLGARAAPGLKQLAAIGLVPICSALGGVVLAVVLGVLAVPVTPLESGSVLAGIAYDTVIAIVVVPVVTLVLERRAQAGHVYG